MNWDPDDRSQQLGEGQTADCISTRRRWQKSSTKVKYFSAPIIVKELPLYTVRPTLMVKYWSCARSILETYWRRTPLDFRSCGRLPFTSILHSAILKRPTQVPRVALRSSNLYVFQYICKRIVRICSRICCSILTWLKITRHVEHGKIKEGDENDGWRQRRYTRNGEISKINDDR